MTLIGKTHVKNHLSTRSGRAWMFPFGLTPPNATPAPENSDPETRTEETQIAVNPDRSITPEAEPHPSIANSFEIPTRAGAFGNAS